VKKQFKDTEYENQLKKLDSDFLWKTNQKQDLRNRLFNSIELIESQEKLNEGAFQAEKDRKKGWTFTIIKYTAAIALISLLTVSSAIASPAFANFVTQIPLIGTAFNYFVTEKVYYEGYEKLSTAIGVIEESDGVDIIIDQAIYDGNMVTLSFIIRTDEDFGTSLDFENLPQLQGGFTNSAYEIEYVKDIGYVGVMTLSMILENRETVNIAWKPSSITSDNKTIKGDWKFQFSLKEIPNNKIPINQEVSNKGVTVRLIDASKTDVNLSINYSQIVDPNLLEIYEYVEAELYAIDNLGNEYKVPYNGGEGIVGSNSSEDWMWNATVHGLDEKATSITFYPFANVSNLPNELNDVNSNRIDFEPITVNLK